MRTGCGDIVRGMSWRVEGVKLGAQETRLYTDHRTPVEKIWEFYELKTLFRVNNLSGCLG